MQHAPPSLCYWQAVAPLPVTLLPVAPLPVAPLPLRGNRHQLTRQSLVCNAVAVTDNVAQVLLMKGHLARLPAPSSASSVHALALPGFVSFWLHPHRHQPPSKSCAIGPGPVLQSPRPPSPPSRGACLLAVTNLFACRVRRQHVHSEPASQLPQPADCRLRARGGAAGRLHGQSAGRCHL